MRAASSSEDGIKVVSDESDISHTADETATVCIRLTGRQIVHHRRAEAVGTNFGNTRARNVPRVRPNRRDHYTRGSSRQFPFGDIKKAV